MTPEPTDKLDAATHVAVNGPADDALLNDERIVRLHATGPTVACLSRMPGNWHVRLYVQRTIMLNRAFVNRFLPAQSDISSWVTQHNRRRRGRQAAARVADSGPRRSS
jgi:hypothetical protein